MRSNAFEILNVVNSGRLCTNACFSIVFCWWSSAVNEQ